MDKLSPRNPNIRKAAVGVALAFGLGATACSGPEAVSPTRSTVAFEGMSAAEYYRSPERNTKVSEAVQTSSNKIITAYESGKLSGYIISAPFTDRQGIEQSKGNFVSLWPRDARDPKADTNRIGIYAYLDENGLFDLSKGSEVIVFAPEREVAFMAPTKVIAEGSTERYVEPITSDMIPRQYWNIDVQYHEGMSQPIYAANADGSRSAHIAPGVEKHLLILLDQATEDVLARG